MYCCACRWQCILSVYQYVLLCVRYVASEFTTFWLNTETLLSVVKTFLTEPFGCCTASMEQATDRAETAAIDGLVPLLSENISVSFCLQAPGYGLTLWCALVLLIGGAVQVPQLQLLAPHGAGHPFFPLSLHFPVFCSFLLFFGGFNYFFLSISFLSTRIVPLRFQAGGCRRQPNLGLVCCVYFVLSVFLS